MSTGRASHRDRIVTAMVATAARYGYGDASVARVVKEAGVSRATFYEHFADREECFLAAYRAVAERLVEAMEGHAVAAGGPTLLERLLTEAERDPAAARVILIESQAGPPVVRAEHERLLDATEAIVQRYIDAGSRGECLDLPARALLGGLAGVISIRLFRGEASRLGPLAKDLATWVDSYALPPGKSPLAKEDWAELGAGVVADAVPDTLGEAVLAGRLPRGRGALPASVVTGAQRERILAAVALLSREKGFAAMTVDDLVATASVPREKFYAQFRGKGDAFLAAQAHGLEKSVALTAGRFFSSESWLDRVWDGLETLASFVAGQRDLVYVDLVESFAAGPAAIRRSFENRMAYTLFLEDGYRQRPEAERLPRICSEAISGAIYEMMRRRVIAEGPTTMLEALPQVVYVSAAPFAGPEATLRLIEARSGRPTERLP